MTMMRTPYPNGVIDTQGQDVSGVENTPEVRAQFIAEHMKVYSMDGADKSEIELSPFTISIMDQSNGQYAALFYKACIGQYRFVFPLNGAASPLAPPMPAMRGSIICGKVTKRPQLKVLSRKTQKNNAFEYQKVGWV